MRLHARYSRVAIEETIAMKKSRTMSGLPAQAHGQTMYAPPKKRNSLTAGLYKMFMRERKQAEKTGKESAFEILPRYCRAGNFALAFQGNRTLDFRMRLLVALQ